MGYCQGTACRGKDASQPSRKPWTGRHNKADSVEPGEGGGGAQSGVHRWACSRGVENVENLEAWAVCEQLEITTAHPPTGVGPPGGRGGGGPRRSRRTRSRGAARRPPPCPHSLACSHPAGAQPLPPTHPPTHLEAHAIHGPIDQDSAVVAGGRQHLAQRLPGHGVHARVGALAACRWGGVGRRERVRGGGHSGPARCTALGKWWAPK